LHVTRVTYRRRILHNCAWIAPLPLPLLPGLSAAPEALAAMGASRRLGFRDDDFGLSGSPARLGGERLSAGEQ